MRRSIFNNSERNKYLNTLIFGVRDILENHADASCEVGWPPVYLAGELYCLQTLVDSQCYHEFCRLLSRLKANFQLSELMESDIYSSFIQEVAKFTVMSIQVWCDRQVVPLSEWRTSVASSGRAKKLWVLFRRLFPSST